jgi:hypothetical protein
MDPAMADAIARLTRLKDEWTHHFAQGLLMGRAAQAKGYGLKPEDYVSPLPGSTDSSVHNYYYGAPLPTNPATSPASPAGQVPSPVPDPSPPMATIATVPTVSRTPSVLSLVLASVMAALAAGTGGYFLHPTINAPTATQPIPIVSPAPKSLEWEFKWQGKDGKWYPMPNPTP